MLFKDNNKKIILLGYNDLSINLGIKLSKKHDVVILQETISNNMDSQELDVIIDSLEDGLMKSLEHYNVNQADSFIALTDNDEYNIFAANIAREMGVSKTAAQIKQADYFKVKHNIELLFNTEQLIIDKISNIIKDTRVLNIKNLIPGRVDVSEIIIKNEDPFSYLKIKNIKLNEGLIIAIKKERKFILPEPEIQLYPGDIIYVLYEKGMIGAISTWIKKRKKRKRLYIYGADSLTFNLIKDWQGLFERIIVIENNLTKCNMLAEKMENVLVINGEGFDQQLLLEEGLDKKSIFLAVSNNDNKNLLSSYMVNTNCYGVTLIHDTKYKDIALKMGLGNVLFSSILLTTYLEEFINKGFLINKYNIGGKIYATEIFINIKTKICNRKIVEANLPAGVLIGLIIRENEIIIPNGHSILEAGDKLIVFFYKKSESRLFNIFKESS